MLGLFTFLIFLLWRNVQSTNVECMECRIQKRFSKLFTSCRLHRLVIYLRLCPSTQSSRPTEPLIRKLPDAIKAQSMMR